MRLKGQSALVTGGGSGIGRATVEKFVAEGARVALLDRDEAAGRSTMDALEGRGEILFYRADVTSESDVEKAIARAAEQLGGVDILVNNAGVNTYFDATRMTEAEWDAVFAVDLKGAWLCCKHALPLMLRAGVGSIVNIASIHATLTIAGMFPYAAAKSGLIGLTRSLALDCASQHPCQRGLARLDSDTAGPRMVRASARSSRGGAQHPRRPPAAANRDADGSRQTGLLRCFRRGFGDHGRRTRGRLRLGHSVRGPKMNDTTLIIRSEGRPRRQLRSRTAAPFRQAAIDRPKRRTVAARPARGCPWRSDGRSWTFPFG